MGTKESWREYVAFLKKHVPASYANLAPGATDETIARLEKKLGVSFPEPVKAVWRLNDGQKKTMLADTAAAATPCVPTLSFLSTKAVAKIWKEWDEVRKDAGEEGMEELDSATSSAVPGVVKALYSSPKWIPLWAHPTSADYIGLDLDPDTDGVVGQIINFGRDEDEHFQVAASFDELLELLLAEVREGNWKADQLEDGNKTVPWFGDPDDSFFNTLHDHAEKRAKKAKKPAAKKAAAKKTAPAPLPITTPKLGTHVVPEALQTRMAPLTAALVRQLEIGAGKHRRARFHLEIDRRGSTLDVAATTGNLASTDAEMIQREAPFAYGDKYQKVQQQVIEATDKIAPLYMLDYVFEKGASGWTHVWTVQTIEDRKASDRQRKALDAQLLALLQSHAEPPTGRAVLELGDERLVVGLVANGKRDEPPPSPADRAMLSAYEAFYRERGFELFVFYASINMAKPNRLSLLRISYGVPRTTSATSAV